MPLKLSHHVYSSLEGYRTIYASEDMPSRLVSSLEALAKKMYRPAQTRDIFAWLGADDGTTCVVKAFQNGTDHAGRRRSCVHAVVFSARDAAGRWFFTPFSLPTEGEGSVFISPESSLQSVANELEPEYDLPAPSPSEVPAGLRRECLTALLSLMLSPSTRALILDRNGEALSAVRSLSWMLPPPVRQALTVSAFAALPEVDGLAGPRIAILPYHMRVDDELAGDVWKPDVVIDFPSGGGRPKLPFNVYAEFTASSLAKKGGAELVRKLVELLERHPPRLELTHTRYIRMLQGFARVEPRMERGIVDVRHDVLESLEAAEEFALAGMPAAALDILDSVVSTMQDDRGGDAAPLRAALARVREGKAAGHERHTEALVFLAEKLKDAFGEIG